MKIIVSLLGRLKSFQQSFCKEYIWLCRPKLLLFILFCALVGLLLSMDNVILWNDIWLKIVPGVTGIMLAAAGGVVYHQLMSTAKSSPEKYRFPFNNQICRDDACCFSLLLCLAAVFLLAWVNYLILALVWFAFLAHAVLYSAFLKHQNSSKIMLIAVVFSLTPILGWSVVSTEFNPQVWSLALVIFFWVHIYNWISSIKEKFHLSDNQQKALHQAYTILFLKKKIFLATAMVYIMAMSPFLFNLSGEVYILGAFILGIGFLQKAFALLLARMEKDILKLSEILRHYALYYLPSLFSLMVVDHFLFFNPTAFVIM